MLFVEWPPYQRSRVTFAFRMLFDFELFPTGWRKSLLILTEQAGWHGHKQKVGTDTRSKGLIQSVDCIQDTYKFMRDSYTVVTWNSFHLCSVYVSGLESKKTVKKT